MGAGSSTYPEHCRGLFQGIEKIVGVHDSDDVFKFAGPAVSRCPIPVEMFRFFQDADVHFLLRNGSDNVPRAVDGILSPFQPGGVPPDPQPFRRIGHPCRLPQPPPHVLLLLLGQRKFVRVPVNPLSVARLLEPRQHQRHGPLPLPTTRQLRRPQKRIYGRPSHPRQRRARHDPDPLRRIPQIRVGKHRLPLPGRGGDHRHRRLHADDVGHPRRQVAVVDTLLCGVAPAQRPDLVEGRAPRRSETGKLLALRRQGVGGSVGRDPGAGEGEEGGDEENGEGATADAGATGRPGMRRRQVAHGEEYESISRSIEVGKWWAGTAAPTTDLIHLRDS
mmetsp:Transcript_15176/g.33947  ORF Transcript_15176/g.33947 Transcript_15176/m.33947 type:complete len:333 (-) Transcript_15176:137-1135(-)